MEHSRQKQKKVIVNVNANELIKINEYKGFVLKRYYFDKKLKQILLYNPIKEIYQLVKPYKHDTKELKYAGFGLIIADGKPKTLSFEKFYKFVIDNYDK